MSESKLAEALRALEDAALSGVTLHGDDARRMRAVVDRLAAHDARKGGKCDGQACPHCEPEHGCRKGVRVSDDVQDFDGWDGSHEYGIMREEAQDAIASEEKDHDHNT